MPLIRLQEIHRRQVRHKKLIKLRERYENATNASEREKVVTKVLRVCPNMLAKDFLEMVKKK